MCKSIFDLYWIILSTWIVYYKHALNAVEADVNLIQFLEFEAIYLIYL